MAAEKCQMRSGKSLLSAWRWWLPPAGISLVLSLLFIDPFIGDWDALEYTISELRGILSSMVLGRSLFIFYNHGLYVIAHSVFNLPPQRAYLLFKYAVVVQGVLAVIACWKLTRDLTDSLCAPTIAALLVTFSPVFVMFSGQVMTDVPALLSVAVALIIHLRGLRQRPVWVVVGCAVGLGLSVLREFKFCLLVFRRPELSRRLVRLARSHARRKCAASNLDPHRLAMAGFFSGHFATGPDHFAAGDDPRMASAQALAYPAARGRRFVCQPAAAFKLQHRDRVPLSFDGAARALAADRELSGSVANDAVRNCASGIHRGDRGDRLDWCLFRSVFVAVAECNDESESSLERIRSRADEASARRGDDFRGPDSRGQVLARR